MNDTPVKVKETFAYQRTFTTEPKRRIRRGHTIVIHRCYEIAQHMQQCGFKDKARVEDIENAVFYCAGGDPRTANRYIGRDVFSKGVTRQGACVDPPRLLKHIKGYLERIHFAERCGDGWYSLNFAVVPSLVSTNESSMLSNPILCVRRDSGLVTSNELGEVASRPLQDVIKDYTTTTHNTHTNQLGESNQKRVARELTPEERAILHGDAAP